MNDAIRLTVLQLLGRDLWRALSRRRRETSSLIRFLKTHTILSVILGLATVAQSQEGFFDDVRRLPFTDYNDNPTVTGDGQELYFNLYPPDNCGIFDIHVATRQADGEWGSPRRVEEVNTCLWEVGPKVSLDGLELFFFRSPAASGPFSMHVAARSERGQPWGHVRRLEIDSDYDDGVGSLSSDGLTLYFMSNRPEDDFGTKSEGWDLFSATRPSREEPFAMVRNLEEINSSADDINPSVSTDGLAIFWSDYSLGLSRAGGHGGSDLWVATRLRTSDPFGTPINLGPPLSSEAWEWGPGISADWPAPGSRIYFSRAMDAEDRFSYEATWHPDCNGNGIDDLEDIRNGVSRDANGDNTPDECEPQSAAFLRGDANADGDRNVTDAVFVLDHLFGGGDELPCANSADTNDSGTLDIADPIFLLNALFAGGAPIPAPFPDCGPDPTPDELSCLKFEGCD